MEAKNFDVAKNTKKELVRFERMPDGNFKIKRITDNFLLGWIRYLELKDRWFARFEPGPAFRASILSEILDFLIELDTKTDNVIS